MSWTDISLVLFFSTFPHSQYIYEFSFSSNTSVSNSLVKIYALPSLFLMLIAFSYNPQFFIITFFNVSCHFIPLAQQSFFVSFFLQLESGRRCASFLGGCLRCRLHNEFPPTQHTPTWKIPLRDYRLKVRGRGVYRRAGMPLGNLHNAPKAPSIATVLHSLIYTTLNVLVDT